MASVRNKLVEQGLKVKDAELRYIANTPIEIADMETAQKLMKMIDALDDLDDVVMFIQMQISQRNKIIALRNRSFSGAIFNLTKSTLN